MFTIRFVVLSPPVHLLMLLDFKHRDKNPRGKDDAKKKKKKTKFEKKRAKFMITSAREPIICNGSVSHC